MLVVSGWKRSSPALHGRQPVVGARSRIDPALRLNMTSYFKGGSALATGQGTTTGSVATGKEALREGRSVPQTHIINGRLA